MPRKQITLPRHLNEFVCTVSDKTGISQSAVISFSLKKLVDLYNAYIDNDCVDVFFYKVSEFYKNYFISSLPRGKKFKEVNFEKKKTF